MNKGSKNKKTRYSKRMSVKGLTVLVLAGVLISLGAYAAINSIRPTNGNSHMLTIPGNSFIKAVHTPGKGYSLWISLQGVRKGFETLILVIKPAIKMSC